MKSFLKKLYFYLKNKYYVSKYRKLIISRVLAKVTNSDEYLRFYEGRESSEKVFTVLFKDGLKVLCNKSDLSAVSETCLLEDYVPTPQFAVRGGQIVVDVGANIGSYSVYAAHKGAKVFSIEPEPRNVDRLKENIRINSLKNLVTIVPVALHAHTGTVTFTVSSQSVGGHSLVEGMVQGEKIEVPAKSLSDIMQEYSIDNISILKMDIEGAEYEILKNLSPEIFSKINAIVGEYHVSPYSSNGYPVLRSILRKYFPHVGRYNPYYFYAYKN